MHIASQIAIGLINLLPFGEAHLHVIELGPHIEAVPQPGKFRTHPEIVGALILALDIEGGREAEEQLILPEAVGIALCGGHHALGHVGEATGIKQRGDMPIVAEGLARQIDRTTRSVEDTDLITKLLLHQSMHLNAQVKTGPDIGRDRIERMGQDDGSCQRGWQYRQQGLA